MVNREILYDLKNNQVTLDAKTGRVIWFVIYKEGNLAGFGALEPMHDTAGRLKCDYILPQYRGQGLYDYLVKIRLQAAEKLGLSKATGFFNKNSVHCAVKNGFQKKTVRKNQVTFCEKILCPTTSPTN